MSDVADNDTAYAEEGTGTETLDLLEGAGDYNRWIVELIRPYLGERNAELGAGQGTLSELVGETHSVLPFELSAHNQSILRNRFAGHPRVAACLGDLLRYEDWGSLDCIYSANVLEHIQDDLAMIRHSARLLRPGGWFVAFVPAGSWLYAPFDRMVGHQRRYGRTDRERLARVSNGDARLVLREFRYVNAIGALGWFVRMRLLGRTSIDARDVRMAERVLPLAKLVDALTPPFGQSALITLQRR